MKTITKKHLNELSSIEKQAKKLRDKIEKLYNETDNFNFDLNHTAIRYESRHLSSMLSSDYEAIWHKIK